MTEYDSEPINVNMDYFKKDLKDERFSRKEKS